MSIEDRYSVEFLVNGESDFPPTKRHTKKAAFEWASSMSFAFYLGKKENTSYTVNIYEDDLLIFSTDEG